MQDHVSRSFLKETAGSTTRFLSQLTQPTHLSYFTRNAPSHSAGAQTKYFCDYDKRKLGQISNTSSLFAGSIMVIKVVPRLASRPISVGTEPSRFFTPSAWNTAAQRRRDID
jgi:hypothetical protein